MSADCVSSAAILAGSKKMTTRETTTETRIVFIGGLLFPIRETSSSIKFAVLLGRFDIAQRPPGNVLLLIEGQLSPDFRRRAEHERAGRDFRSHRHERVCADDRTRADFDVIEDDGSHANEDFIVDFACVNNCGVADRDQFTYVSGVTSVNVDGSIVLNVRARPYDDAVDITAEDGAVPDAGFLFQDNIPEHRCARDDP